MKRIISCFLLAVLVISAFPVTCFAATVNEESNVIQYFDNGSYLVETFYIIQSRAADSVTGKRDQTYYDSNGNADWKVVLTGTFTYTGYSATCTAASCNVTVYDSTWYTISKSASKSGNTAYGSVVMGQKMLGMTVNEVPASLSLQCDADGNLS